MDFSERPNMIDFYGQPRTVVGADLQVGDPAPEFTAFTPAWQAVQALAATAGKVRIIGSLPSLSSSTCDRETRRFNQEAAALDPAIAILVVSMDLPWTLREWCAAAGVSAVQTLSDHLEADFGRKYGVLLKEVRIFRRAAFVVDQADRLAYVDYLPTIGAEPDYPAVLAAARQALRR